MKKSKVVYVSRNSSSIGNSAPLILSLRYTSQNPAECEVSIAHITAGLPNSIHKISLGDAAYFDVSDSECFEVRLVDISSVGAKFFINQVASRSILVDVADTDSVDNDAFSSAELQQIADSLDKLRLNLAQSSEFNSKQLELINDKLKEIKDTSHRLGRKDWTNYAIAVLSNLCIAAAFSDKAYAIFVASVKDAFMWLSDKAPTLFQLKELIPNVG